jgi:hypothetical protein
MIVASTELMELPAGILLPFGMGNADGSKKGTNAHF